MSTIICNKCGCSVEYATYTEVLFGYPSIHDAETWQFYLCDECYLELAKSFKIAPRGFMDEGYSPRLTSEQHQKTFEDWKKTGKWEEMMYVPYEELINFRHYYEDEYINECIKKYHPEKPLLD